MLQSRQGMRVGRAKFRAGDVDLAIHIWTKALESAYTAQDYAAMYVLSKNLGDAFARLTAEEQQQKKHSTATIESLQKSIDYYEYALNVIDECELREVLSDASHLVLNRSAGHVHAARQRLHAKMERLRKLPPAIEEQPCMTCEELFESLVLDESDGCLYCQACYDAFYASVENVEQESSTTSQVSSVSAEAEIVATVHETEIAGLSIADSADTCGECDNTIEDSSEELAEASISVFSEEPVEDVEATAREPTPPHHEAVVFSAANDTDMDVEVVEKPALEATEKSSSFEAADQDPAQAKQVYTISELLTLRAQTPVGLCPEAILSSPVAVGGDSTSSKTNSAKSWDRKSSSKQSKSSSIKTKKPQTTSPRSTTSNPRHLSALPSMELCNTLRDAVAAPAARKSQGSGSMSLLDIQKMATALFDSGREHASGDDCDEAPSADSCTSFASDLAHFASITDRLTGMTEEQAADAVLTHSFLSYSMLKEVLEASNISDDEEAVMVTRMRVDPRHVDEFERLLRLILKNTHTIGHVSTCVVKPPPGEFTYTSIVKYSSLQAMRKIYPSSVESGVDFYKLLAARDSLLLEPPTYQIEAGFGTWIESDGNTKPMRGDDPDDDENMVYQNVPGPCCNDSCENPHGLNVRASFVVPTKNFQLFQTRYQRNNKKGGQKNLRCFPSCRNGRHVSSGFCGDSIRVHVGVSRVTESGGVKICPIQSTQPIVLTFARFINLDGAFDPTVSGPDVFPGQTIDKADVLAWVRDKEHPMNPLFPGILRGAAMETASQSAIFEFNAECKAWHYGWTAPRGQGLSGSDAQHVLEILFMKPMGAYMYCLERLRSDGFSIYSSRRASHALIKPEPDVYENNNDDRTFKRKRLQVPPSPATTISSTTSNSPMASPEKENSWNGGSIQSPMTTPTNSSSSSSSNYESESMVSDVTSSLANQSFKLENAFGNGRFSSTSAMNSSCPTGFDTSSFGMLLSGNGNGNSAAHHDRQLQQSQYEQQQHDQAMLNQIVQDGISGLLLPQYSPGDLMNHSLFCDLQPPRRVVASEELPWSELYNLFDAVPLPVSANEEDPDRDDDSPGSTPTSSVSGRGDNDNDDENGNDDEDGNGAANPYSSHFASSFNPSSTAILNYL